MNNGVVLTWNSQAAICVYGMEFGRWDGAIFKYRVRLGHEEHDIKKREGPQAVAALSFVSLAHREGEGK